MPIQNQPIVPNRALGRQKKLLWFFPSYLTPGLLAGVTVMAVMTEITKDKIKAGLAGGSVIAAYWLYAGKGEESAWANFGRFLPIPVLHLPHKPNRDTLLPPVKSHAPPQ
ncbi:MAG: hypothetical protein KME35_07690 [Aphanocapsa sp. GSE-SYN-MK-11-07L]|jgi:hypothetical protein|nr:hypothetical protein [Aphanocapsa sp. GSE-SYN-MK-11-07L]